MNSWYFIVEGKFLPANELQGRLVIPIDTIPAHIETEHWFPLHATKSKHLIKVTGEIKLKLFWAVSFLIAVMSLTCSFAAVQYFSIQSSTNCNRLCCFMI